MEVENTSLTSLFLQGLASELFLSVVLACLSSLTQQKSFFNIFLWGMQWSSQPSAMLKGLGLLKFIMSASRAAFKTLYCPISSAWCIRC